MGTSTYNPSRDPQSPDFDSYRATAKHIAKDGTLITIYPSGSAEVLNPEKKIHQLFSAGNQTAAFRYFQQITGEDPELLLPTITKLPGISATEAGRILAAFCRVAKSILAKHTTANTERHYELDRNDARQLMSVLERAKGILE